MLHKMNAAKEPADVDELPEWAKWKGEGAAPRYWWAVNPNTGERTQVYSSYEDYCDD